MILADQTASASGADIILVLTLLAAVALVFAAVLLFLDLRQRYRRARIIADLKQNQQPQLGDLIELPVSALADPEAVARLRAGRRRRAS